MGKVRTGLAVSVDGFISGPNDGAEAPMGVGGERLLAWYGGGDTEYAIPGTDMVFRVSAQTADFLRETRETTGALVFGRRTFDLTHGWGGKHPLNVPVFVVSSSGPPACVYEESPFTFVTDGLESALDQAQRSPATRTSAWAPPASCSSASERDSWTRSTSTWCPSCSAGASDCSTISAPGRSTWSARG
jgi:dihydrofolate reductase